jgi:dynein heavy chain, axonemal
MISECYYGGRVTDEWDRKCLQHILSDIFTVRILSPQYKFGDCGLYLITIIALFAILDF